MKTTQSLIKSINHAGITTRIRSTGLAALGLLSMLLPVSQTAYAQDPNIDRALLVPAVFQAAGPTAASIQGTVDAFRGALGDPNNGNNPGPLPKGRREINWDGGNPAIVATTAPVTPFNVFQNTRGVQFTTHGLGLSQATPAGLAELFSNSEYAKIFTAFSLSRLFTPVGSNVTNGLFFVAGSNGGLQATVNGFGAVFTDVDKQGGSTPVDGTRIDFFEADGKRIFSGVVPASPGNGGLSFFGIKFNDARIAFVRITTDKAPGPNDDRNHDVVMMDDFIYGEPQVIPFGGVTQPERDEP